MAICEGGKTAVVAADKMLKFGAYMTLRMELATLKKITQLNSEPAALLSFGSVPDAEVLSENTPGASGERIAHLETLELSKIAVPRV